VSRKSNRAKYFGCLRPAVLAGATEDVPAINPRASLREWVLWLELVRYINHPLDDHEGKPNSR
jgi:hypothetical protein